jgi:aminodeoxyfutalosine deaminase
VNTDDPVMFETDLVREYALCREQFSWRPTDLVALARTSIESSFAPYELKVQLLSDLANYPTPVDP